MLCAHCDREFEPKRPWGKFCSKSCRWAGQAARRRDQAAKLRELVKVLAKKAGLGPEDFA